MWLHMTHIYIFVRLIVHFVFPSAVLADHFDVQLTQRVSTLPRKSTGQFAVFPKIVDGEKIAFVSTIV